jgi:F0F1-type ATP synthase assembly protein I
MVDSPNRKTDLQKGEISPWALAGLGGQFAVGVLAGVYFGQWIDRKLGTSPVFVLIGAIGLGGAVFVLSYRRLTAAAEKRNAPD